MAGKMAWLERAVWLGWRKAGTRAQEQGVVKKKNEVGRHGAGR